MSYNRGVDVAFEGAGTKTGLEIWCMENLRLAPVPKSSHGNFFSGSSYIILNTVLLKNGLLQHDIHYWLGKDAKEVDSAMASDKAVELDAALGYHAVQYREAQGYETEKFLSCFKPCIIPIAGEYSSEFGRLESQMYRVRLLTCKGDHVVRVREVPFSRSSLNHTDVFILDTESKIFLFSGSASRIQERAKALEVVQYIKDNKHHGRCEVATIEDGKFVGDPDVGEFWSFFGGYAPINRVPFCTDDTKRQTPSAKLFWITHGKLCFTESSTLKKEMLSIDKCYLLDCDTEIFIWMGRNTTLMERKTSISATEDIVRSQGRSMSTHITFLKEGSETSEFKSYFDDWPQTFVLNLYEEGRGKVAALFKHQGFDVRELPEEDCEPFIDCTGSLKVWRVNDHNITPVPITDKGKLYSGDCYIVWYTYLGNQREENLFYAWLGGDSIMEERVEAISHMSAMVDSVKVAAVLGGLSSGYKRYISEKRIVDETYDGDKVALFRVQGSAPDNMQAIQANPVSSSLNSSYCHILQTGASVFAWTGNLSSPRKHDLLDRMLDVINRRPSWFTGKWVPMEGSFAKISFGLQSSLGMMVFLGWTEIPLKVTILWGMPVLPHFQRPPSQFAIKWETETKLSHQMATLEFLSNQPPRLVKEGSEPDAFWNALGGKTEYPREKEIKAHLEEPHLFVFLSAVGDFKVKEIYNFTQDDLTTEDVFVLDCHHEIYVWIGQHTNFRSKQQAITLGKKFLEQDILHEGLSLETAIYVITEGCEPPFFTRFFNWDSLKASMLGNSFERKLAILKGMSPNMMTPRRCSLKAYGTGSSESTLDRSRSKYVSSNRLQIRSKSPAFSALASAFETPNSGRLSAPPPVVRKLFPRSSPVPSASKEASFESPVKGTLLSQFQQPKDGVLQSVLVEEELHFGLMRKWELAVKDGESTEVDDDLKTYPYERLKVSSNDPITSIDVTKREAYLSNEEFQSKFRMTKKAFYQLPKWRQHKHKMSLDLF